MSKCKTGKRGYSEKQAKIAANGLEKRSKLYCRPYPCKRCDEWHLSRMYGEAKFAKPKRPYKRNKKWRKDLITD